MALPLGRETDRTVDAKLGCRGEGPLARFLLVRCPGRVRDRSGLGSKGNKRDQIRFCTMYMATRSILRYLCMQCRQIPACLFQAKKGAPSVNTTHIHTYTDTNEERYVCHTAMRQCKLSLSDDLGSVGFAICDLRALLFQFEQRFAFALP